VISILDTSGVSALTPIDERSRARLRALRAETDEIIVPAAVLAEGVLSGHPGRDHHVRRLLGAVAIAEVDEHIGFAAGALRARTIRAGADPAPSGVDAMVVAVADERAAIDDVQIVTSDLEDLGALASFGHHAERVGTLRV
jgi:predicted nucleic acid-binding protein